MANRRILLPWDSQPAVGAELNPENPLTKGMLFAGLPMTGGYWDASDYHDHAIVKSGSLKTPGEGPTFGKSFAYTTADSFRNTGKARAPTAEMSMAVWLNIDTTAVAYGIPFGRYGTTGATDTNGDWGLSHNNTSKVLCYTRNGEVIAAAGAAVAAGDWYLWVMTVGPDGMIWYRNYGPTHGMYAVATSASTRIRGGSGAFGINEDGNGTGRTDDRIGRCYAWDRKITADDVAALFSSELELFKQRPLTVPVSAGGGGTVTATVSVSAAIQAARNATASVNAAIQASQSASASVNAAVAQARTVQAALDAAVLQARNTTASVDAAVQQALSSTASVDAVIQAAGSASSTVNAAVQAGQSATTSVNAYVQAGSSQVASVDAVIQQSRTGNATIDAVVSRALTASASLAAAVLEHRSATAGINAYIQAGTTIGAGIEAAIQAQQGASASINAAVSVARLASVSLGAVIALHMSVSAAVSAAVLAGRTATASLGAYVFDDSDDLYPLAGLTQGYPLAGLTQTYPLG